VSATDSMMRITFTAVHLWPLHSNNKWYQASL
jgi:hypothetical protein